MVRRVAIAFLVACALTAGGAWASDDWDLSSNPDNTAGNTLNRLTHGAAQQHDVQDLAGPALDQDWYIVYAAGRSSYEVIADGYSGQFVLPTRYTADGGTSLQGSTGIDGGDYAYATRWINTSSAISEQRVRALPILTGNTTFDRYDIRFYETTIFLARFNNSGGQATVVLCQNPTSDPIDMRQYYWNGAGTLLATNIVTVAAHATSAAVGVSGTANQSGSITIAHNGPYGSLNCKSVALDPATGFSFDTPGVYRVK